MENPMRLGANIKDLQLEFDILNRIRDEVCNKGAPLNDEREREALKMVDIQKEYEELQGGLNPDQLNGTLKLNMQVIESLKAVKVLKQSTVDTFLHEIPGDKLKRFSHDDLDSITSKFSVPIGSGGFGKVYRGQFLNGGLHVAVKVLIQSEVIEEIFMIEVNTMLKASHPNIIKLYGFCFDSKTKALVYEYMKMGSLDKIVYKKPLSIKWEKLYDIATETAKALAYLHHSCGDQVIHHDLKPANVLLDTNFSPKITDFGTARILSRDVRSFTMTKIRGTCGYTAPEMVLQSSRVTYTCDVYSFGMMLFDFLGMRNDTKRESLLPGEFWEKVRDGELDETIKEFGISENDKEKARLLSVVALWCVQFTPRIRPSMTDVVDALEKESRVAMPPDPSFSWNMDVSMQQSSGMNYSSAFPSKDKSLPKTKYGARQRKESSPVLPRSTLERFSHGDLQSFTNNFSTIVDSDEFGDIYKGEFTNGMQVAVRVLAEMDITEDRFVSEVSTMAMTYHPNIIKLYGYCFDGNMKAFVHEKMGSMSLHNVLHGIHLNVEWEQLYGIAIETANVISYLHDGHCKRIIHCDIKPGNVLLDSYNTPKLKNFELAKFLSKNEKYLTLTRLRGTPGYTAPEMWMSTSQVTSKCDVYSFGIMLLDILAMRRNSLNQAWFPREVWKKFKNGQLEGLINECCINDEDREKARVLAKLALWCIQFTPHIRPSMRSVVNILENEIQVATPPNPFLPSDLELLMQPSREAIYLIFSPYIDERLLENKLCEGLTNPTPVQFSRRPHTNTSIEITPDHSLSTPKESREHIKKESIEMTLSELPTFTLKQFSHKDIMRITEYFSIKVGADASGEVYEGRFPNGLQVLVKMYQDMDRSDEFVMNEMRAMRNIDHPNIVKLYGYCDEDNMRALVHEYAKLSLDVILFDKHFEIEWEQLYGITVDTAKALSYLHNDCQEQIIHFDVKPAVVMVDSNFSPKITNFESAELMNNSHLTVSRVRGTRGYAAPEVYSPYAQVTCKSDVYSFGMLLFEALGKRLNISEKKWFPRLIWEKFEKREIEEIMKECQIAEKNREKALILCMVGFWCIQFTPEARPSMNTVVNILENEIQVTVPPDPFLPSMRACSMKPSQEATWSTVSPVIHREKQGTTPPVHSDPGRDSDSGFDELEQQEDFGFDES